MKKLSFISGFIIASLIFGSIAVFAAGGSMIEVFYNIKDIKINKVSKMPEQKPFIYNGTTYVPLRFISENLGEEVKWDGKTQTIHVGEMEEETAVYPGDGIEYMGYQEGYSLYDFKYINYSKNIAVSDGSFYEKTVVKVKDNTGVEYNNSIRLYIRETYSNNNHWNEISFPLNGQYKQFKSTIGLTELSKDTRATGELIILLDGENVLSKEMKSGVFSEKFNIDVTNSNKITFRFTSDNKDNIDVGLFDSYFTK